MAKIHTIKLGMVNSFLIEDNGYILVDTGMNKNPKKILDKLEDLNVLPEQINLIILTHNHEDHISGLEVLRETTKAKVLIHKLDYMTLMDEETDEIKPMTTLAKFIFKFRGIIEQLKKRNKSEVSPVEYEFDIIIEDEFDLNPFGVNGKVVHTPGHSKGSVSIVVGTKAIIGDSLMAMMPWSRPCKPMVAYDLSEIKMSMIRLIDMNVKSFYLSHGNHYDIHEITKTIETLG